MRKFIAMILAFCMVGFTPLAFAEENLGFPKVSGQGQVGKDGRSWKEGWFKSIYLEGATEDGYETRITPAEPAADRTITVPNETGTLITSGTVGLVTTGMITDNAVTSAKIAADVIVADDISTGAVTTTEILDATIATGDITDNAITSAKIAADVIVAGDISTDAVTTTEILDGTIATADITDNAITSAKIAADVIIAADISTDAVTTTEILDGTIATADITDSAITSAKIAADVIVADDISTGAVTTTEILDGTITAADIANIVRYYQLPLNSFLFENTGAPLSTSTTPGLEIDDAIPGIVWADGETSAVMVTFVIPEDYASGGAFKVIATESGASTPNQIDFDVYVNADGVAADSAATGQTPVALAGTSSTPDVVTLTPATDFDSLAAGNWVTLRIWRDDTATGTNDLEVKGVSFFYTATE